MTEHKDLLHGLHEFTRIEDVLKALGKSGRGWRLLATAKYAEYAEQG